MALEMCRLCLSDNKLKPIFPDFNQTEKSTTMLALTTGLKIHANDGLPQKICEKCSDSMNEFIMFRNRAHASEVQLLKLGFQRAETQIKYDFINNINDDYLDVLQADCLHCNKTFKNEVESDRIIQNDDDNREPTELALSLEPEKDLPKNRNRKEMHQLYLSLVEGEFLSNGPVKCKICKKTINKWKSFINHAKKHLGSRIEVESHRQAQVENEIEEPIMKPVESEGGKITKSRKEMRQMYISLVEGKLVPEGPVKCKVCKLTVSSWNSFIHHARKHLGFKIVCEFCGKSFISSNQLKRHCRSFHGMERDLKCKHCNYLALDTPQLTVHERRVHTGERPFVCDQCAAAYFSRKCLLQHIESHRTTACVQCDKCPMSFKSRRHLAKHVYGTHSEKRRERRRERRLASKDPVLLC